MHRLKWIIVCLAVAGWLLLPRLSMAHAKMIGSDPVSGSTLKTAPRQITLLFTEDVGLDFSTARLLNRDQNELPVGELSHTGSNTATLLVPVEGELPSGVYTLLWRVVSGIDGHLTVGTIIFRVGAAELGEEPLAPSGVDAVAGSPTLDSSPDPLRWLVRAFILAAATFLLGGALLTVLVVEPASSASGPAGDALWKHAGVRFAGLSAVVAATLLVALGLDLVAQVGLITGTDYISALARTDTMLTLLDSTRFGFAWTVKAVATALLLILMLLVWGFNRRGGSGVWELSIAAGSLLLLAQALSSHAAAAVNSGQLLGLPVPLISDWLHLVTVAAWVGGLLYMGLVLFPTFAKLHFGGEQRGAFLSKSIPRFSRIAIVSVVMLAATGTYNLVVHSRDPVAVLASRYGQVLLLKLLLFGVLLALGAVNLRRITPRLQGRGKVNATPLHNGGQQAGVGSLWRNIKIEIGLAGLALVCAGGLTLLPPPAESLAGAPPTATASPSALAGAAPVTATQTLAAGYRATLQLMRGDIDTVRVDLVRTSAAAVPLTDVTSLLLRVTPQDMVEPSTAYDGNAIGSITTNSAAWMVDGPGFVQSEGYVANLLVRRSGAVDLRFAFRVDPDGANLEVGPIDVLQVRLNSEPSPPAVGPLSLNITLLDGSGVPVRKSVISVLARRSVDTSIQSEAQATQVSVEQGTYIASLNLSENGSWLLFFQVETEGSPPQVIDASIDVAGQ